MSTPKQFLWRVLAVSSWIGALGLGAFYYGVQEPKLDPPRAPYAPLPQAREQQIVYDTLPPQRLASVCEDLKEALEAFADAPNQDAQIAQLDKLFLKHRIRKTNSETASQVPIDFGEQQLLTVGIQSNNARLTEFLRELQSIPNTVGAFQLSLERDKKMRGPEYLGQLQFSTLHGHSPETTVQNGCTDLVPANHD